MTMTDAYEREVHPNGRCAVCGGGEGYWRHYRVSDHEFIPEGGRRYRHEYKGSKGNVRTLCGGKWYKTGFAPCELPRVWTPGADVYVGNTAADIRAWAELTGAVNCAYHEVRSPDAVSGHDDGYVVQTIQGQSRKVLP